MNDFYLTIREKSEGLYKEKMSKFISFAIPVITAEEAKEIVRNYQKEYFDARHVCWAYMIGAERTEYMSNDNGEPSGTAGKPILGQINSFNLTNILIIVVRYFGGIKLGTSGLISAYREAASDAVRNATVIECHEMRQITFTFPYLSMNDVMKILKKEDAAIISQNFDNLCSITISVRAGNATCITGKISEVDGTSVLE